MSALAVNQSHCAWCVLPKATKGLIIGLVGSFLFHAATLGAVAHFGSREPQVKKQARLYLGEITIIAPKKRSVSNTAKEI